MLFRVILDCRPANAGNTRPFITVKFVDCGAEEEAIAIAVQRTKLLMAEKGFAEADVSGFEFLTESIEPFDAEDAVFGVERAFAYYSED